MKRLRLAAICAAVLAVAACETPYREYNPLFGGVKATRIDESTVQIEAKGNSDTSPATLERYILRRAAEETLKSGFDYFAMASGKDGGNQVGGFVPSGGAGFFFSEIEPRSSAIVKMYRGQKPADAPPNVYDARGILKFLGPPKT